MSSTARAHPIEDDSQLVHEALMYATADDFVAGTVPFLRAGLGRGEAALVASTQEHLRLLREALGDDADGVDWRDSADFYRRPVDTIKALKRHILERLGDGAARVRVVGEPVWPAAHEPEVGEWKRYESMLNLLLGPLPAWVLCPYDTTLLSESVLDDAQRTHPLIGHAASREPSARYLEPRVFFGALDSEHDLPAAPAGVRTVHFGTITEVRELAVAEAAAAGLSRERIRDFELAACEMATNAVRHGAEGAAVRAWVTDGELVFEVLDTGGGMDRLSGYEEPGPLAVGGWGLLLARKLCDAVELRTGPRGTHVRLRVRLAS